MIIFKIKKYIIFCKINSLIHFWIVLFCSEYFSNTKNKSILLLSLIISKKSFKIANLFCIISILFISKSFLKSIYKLSIKTRFSKFNKLQSIIKSNSSKLKIFNKFELEDSFEKDWFVVWVIWVSFLLFVLVLIV